jgi:hypothetical protein
MDNVMTKGFCELNENEMMGVDGGALKDVLPHGATQRIICAIGGPGVWLGVIVYNDLHNCYENGYNQGYNS